MLNLSRRILISAPKESVRLYLRDLEKMAEYEQKLDKVDQVSYPDAQSGFVEVSGKFLGVPWRGAFKTEFTNDGGYHAEMVRGPLPMVRNIRLRPVLGGTMVTHQEHYYFPRFLWPVAYMLRGRLERNVDKGLGVIKEGAERLHRRLQIEQIGP
ncbi:MAG: hypothetical protein A3J74_04530 [Elusimicrobia bacterium RIFCSPHIGHO2_02_FULL_57_9]|nr:MAG: hypothetical protein A3J74_04530 [Elusimicrobia bacterium RIFCSPHIGHO2_02_FULL_57_9]